MANFWKTLPHPFLVLAPMEDVTDVVFREVVATLLPRPHVFSLNLPVLTDLRLKGLNEWQLN